MSVWAVAIFTILPLVVFRGRALARYYAIDVMTYALAWLLWQQTWALVPYPLVVFFFTAKLALFAVFVATSREVRWSANRAAVLAALVYTLLIPAMTRTPIDGDEPYYLLITESIVHDGDLDLANQYRDIAKSASGRTDLAPQTGDPTGPNGEQYSRHEALLPLLMAPGYALGGLRGALAILVLFAALLVRSTMRLLEDEGIDEDVVRALFPFFAFGAPIVFYAARIWPEVPAAWLFVEALRGVRNRRIQRWAPALLGLVLLKLRFVLIAVVLLGRLLLNQKRLSARKALIALVITVLPLAVWFLITGNITAVHRFDELLPGEPAAYPRAFFGLLLDGAAGLLFQAPIYLLGIYAVTRWRSMPATFRLGVSAVALYILYLLPRPEWHGGWAPPLRYVVVVMPVLALGAAVIWRRVPSIVIALAAIWTTVVTAHGVAYPWRLFHIANGENVAGEFLSISHRSDFSRLFPSFIRMNDAAWIAAIALVALFVIIRFVKLPPPVIAGAFALALGLLVAEGRKPGRVIEFEDAHVEHRGGELFPPQWTQGRFQYRGGWLMRGGDSLSFLARAGEHQLEYTAGARMRISLDGETIELAPTGAAHRARTVRLARGGRIELHVLNGEINLDRMTHER